MRKLLAFILLTLCLSTAAIAQDITKPCEQCIDSLSAVTAERDSLKLQLQLSGERDKLKDELITNLREQAAFYKQAAESFQKASGERATANETDALRIDILRGQVADYKIELDRVRRELEQVRSSRKWIGLFGAAVGFGAGYQVGNK